MGDLGERVLVAVKVRNRNAFVIWESLKLGDFVIWELLVQEIWRDLLSGMYRERERE